MCVLFPCPNFDSCIVNILPALSNYMLSKFLVDASGEW